MIRAEFRVHAGDARLMPRRGDRATMLVRKGEPVARALDLGIGLAPHRFRRPDRVGDGPRRMSEGAPQILITPRDLVAQDAHVFNLSQHRMGARVGTDFQTRAEAERALEKVAERNAEWDAEDARWEGLKP